MNWKIPFSKSTTSNQTPETSETATSVQQHQDHHPAEEVASWKRALVDARVATSSAIVKGANGGRAWLQPATTSIGKAGGAVWARFKAPKPLGDKEESPTGDVSHTSSRKQALIGAGVVAGAVAGGVATPLVVIGAVKMAGFATSGIVAGSAGASLMSASATSCAWLLPTVSACQSIGATASLGAASTSIWAGCGGALSYFGLRKLTPLNDEKEAPPADN